MLFPKFELAKQKHPELAELLDHLMVYMQRQIRNGEKFFIPKLAAAALGLSDGEAFVLLELLARAGTVQRAFNVYCKKDGGLLTTVHSETELNGVPHCDECDDDHSLDDLRLEIAFEPFEEPKPALKAA